MPKQTVISISFFLFVTSLAIIIISTPVSAAPLACGVSAFASDSGLFRTTALKTEMDTNSGVALYFTGLKTMRMSKSTKGRVPEGKTWYKYFDGSPASFVKLGGAKVKKIRIPLKGTDTFKVR